MSGKSRVICVLITALLVLTALPFAAVAAEKFAITVDGEEKLCSPGETVDLAGDDGGYLYSEIDIGGKKVLFTSPLLVPSEGMNVTTHRVPIEMHYAPEFRFGDHSGLRFVTTVDAVKFDALKEDPNIVSVKIGTLITPREFLHGGREFSVEAFTEAAKKDASVKLLNIPAEAGNWYKGVSRKGKYAFAGSIAEIKEENMNREFVGIGYIEIELTGGKTAILHAPYDKDTNGSSVAELAKEIYDTEAVRYSKTQVAQLKEYADKFVEADSRKTWVRDLEGLNVLAIGDSLFDGDYLSGDQQWIGLLAKECDWNFVNLGHDGWTVAKNPGAYVAGDNERASIYDKLYNDPSFTYNGSGASYKYGTTTGKTANDVDLILLEGGVNDWGHNLPLGSLSDTDLAKGDNLYGAYNLILQKLLDFYPYATIICVTSWRVSQTRGDGALRTDFAADAVMNLVAEKYGTESRVQVIDAGDPSVSDIWMRDEWWRINYGKSSSDTNHLGPAGMQIMQQNMLPLIWQIMKK